MFESSMLGSHSNYGTLSVERALITREPSVKDS